MDQADLKVTADSRTWLGFVAKERSLVWGLASAKDPVQGIATIAARLRYVLSVVIEQCYAQDDRRDRRTHHSRHSDLLHSSRQSPRLLR